MAVELNPYVADAPRRLNLLAGLGHPRRVPQWRIRHSRPVHKNLTEYNFAFPRASRGRFNAVNAWVAGSSLVNPGHDVKGSNALAFEPPHVFSTSPQLPLKEP